MKDREDTIVLKAVGDVCLDGVEGDPFLHVAGMLRADLLFCNLECCFAAGGAPHEDKITFKAPAHSADYLKRHGFNLICLANNHVLDYGPEGLVDTLEALEGRGIRFFGAGRNRGEAEEPLRFEHRGVRFAVLSAADATGGRSGGPTISVLTMRALRGKVASLRRETDVLIVSYHGGIELQTLPSPFVVRGLRGLVDAGADVVLAHHPHVLQPVEMYRGKIIVYSLGNFVFDNGRYGEFAALASRAMALEIRIPPGGLTSGGLSFRASSEKKAGGDGIGYVLHPVTLMEDCLPRPSSAEEAKEFFSSMESLAASLENVRADGVDVQRMENLAGEIHRKSLKTIIRYGIRHAGDFSLKEIVLGIRIVLKRAISRLR